MEKENLAIRISGVKKEYRLGNIGGRTLQADLQSWFARKRGREDPNDRKRKYLHERNDSWNVKSGDQKQNGTDH